MSDVMAGYDLSGQVAVLGFTMPLWAALLGALFLGQRVSARMAAALALGGAAVGLLLWRTLPAYAQAPTGFALGLVSAVGWAVGAASDKEHGIHW